MGQREVLTVHTFFRPVMKVSQKEKVIFYFNLVKFYIQQKKMKIYYFLKFLFDFFFTSGDVKQKVS